MKAVKSKKSSAPVLITNGSNGELTHDEIALRAFSIWEEQGRPHNHDFEHWLQAESQLRQAHQKDATRA